MPISNDSTDKWGSGEWSVQELIRGAEIIDGLPFVRIEEVLKWKRLNGREKDLKDAELIGRYLDLGYR